MAASTLMILFTQAAATLASTVLTTEVRLLLVYVVGHAFPNFFSQNIYRLEFSVFR